MRLLCRIKYISMQVKKKKNKKNRIIIKWCMIAQPLFFNYGDFLLKAL